MFPWLTIYSKQRELLWKNLILIQENVVSSEYMCSRSCISVFTSVCWESPLELLPCNDQRKEERCQLLFSTGSLTVSESLKNYSGESWQEILGRSTNFCPLSISCFFSHLYLKDNFIVSFYIFAHASNEFWKNFKT